MSRSRVAALSDRVATRATRDSISSGIRVNRPALLSSSHKSITTQSTSSIRMNRPALRSSLEKSSAPSQLIPRIRMNRPALQHTASTAARSMPSNVEVAPANAADVIERSKASRARLAEFRTRAVPVKPSTAANARSAARAARITERSLALEESRQQTIPQAAPRSQKCSRPRVPSPTTILIESLSFLDAPAAPSKPSPPVSLPPVVLPPTPTAPRAVRFNDVSVRPVSFPVSTKPKDLPALPKGILRKTASSRNVATKKTVTFDTEPKIRECERWIGIWQGTEPVQQLFTDTGVPISGRGLHVCPDPARLTGKLRGWLPIDDDKLTYTFFMGEAGRDHSDCHDDVCRRGRYHRIVPETFEATRPISRRKCLQPVLSYPTNDDPWRWCSIPGDLTDRQLAMPLQEYQRLFMRPAKH